MKGKLIWTGIIVVMMLAAGVAGYYTVNAIMAENHESSSRANANDDTEHHDKKSDADQEDHEGHKEPELTTIEADEVNSEDDIIHILHEMTHQKVKAKEKWGAVAMTKENVEAMFSMVKDKKDDLDHYDLYIGMLKDWKRSDFSKADKQHNQLWKLEDGTIGKAEGLLNKEKEKAYIKDHFNDNEGTFKW